MRLEQEAAGLDTTVLEAVLDCGKPEARLALARQLCALVADPETAAVERDQVVPVILKLAADPERIVRETLADELSTVENLHQDIIFAVIADEDSIALPFLAATPSLNSWHMQAILRVGDDGRQRTIAAREDLSAESAMFIIRAGTPAAVVSLMKNSKIKLKVTDLQQIYGRLHNASDVVDLLLTRKDLPLDIRIVHARRAAVRMRQMMAERGWMPANDANELVSDAEEGAVLQVLKQSGPEDRMRALSFLSSQNMLTPSLIVRAACLGEMEMVAATVGHLSGYSAERVHNLLVTRGGAGIRSMLNKSMLPQGCAAVVACACDVAAQARDEDIELDADNFGRRLLEALMLQFGSIGARDQAKLMDYVGRFADDRVRKIARRLKSDMLRAA
jgi:uncharacterized protein (DUF2336 family)